MKANPVKTLIIGKLIPGIVRIVPVLDGALKMDFNKFLIIDFLMIIYKRILRGI